MFPNLWKLVIKLYCLLKELCSDWLIDKNIYLNKLIIPEIPQNKEIKFLTFQICLNVYLRLKKIFSKLTHKYFKNPSSYN